MFDSRQLDFSGGSCPWWAVRQLAERGSLGHDDACQSAGTSYSERFPADGPVLFHRALSRAAPAGTGPTAS
jgi:hypothetical protein